MSSDHPNVMNPSHSSPAASNLVDSLPLAPKENSQTTDKSLIPKALDVTARHRELVVNVSPMIRESRNFALLEGCSSIGLVGFVWDCNDRLLPQSLKDLPASKQVQRAVKQNQSPILAGVLTQKEMLEHFTYLAYRLERRSPPLILHAAQPEPGLLKILRTFRAVEDKELPVIVIAAERISIQSIPVSSLVQLPPKPLPKENARSILE